MKRLKKDSYNSVNKSHLHCVKMIFYLRGRTAKLARGCKFLVLPGIGKGEEREEQKNLETRTGCSVLVLLGVGRGVDIFTNFI